MRDLQEKRNSYINWCTADNSPALKAACLEQGISINHAIKAEEMRLAKKRVAELKIRDERIIHSSKMSKCVKKERSGHDTIVSGLQHAHRKEERRLQS